MEYLNYFRLEYKNRMGEDVERQPLLNQEHGNITNIFLEHDLMKGGGAEIL